MTLATNKLVEKVSHEVEVRKEELLTLLSGLAVFPTVSPPARYTNDEPVRPCRDSGRPVRGDDWPV